MEKIIHRGRLKIFPANSDGMYPAECMCGTKLLLTKSQVSSRKKSCGCKNSDTPNVQNWGYKDLSGTRYLRLKENSYLRGMGELPHTAQYLWELLNIKQKGKCALTGKQITWADNSASLDRINPAIGYELDNMQVIDYKVNKVKGSLSNNLVFINICRLIHAYQKTGKLNDPTPAQPSTLPRALWTNFVYNARKKSRDIFIQPEDVNECLSSQGFRCYISGLKITFSGSKQTATIWRKDSFPGDDRPYTVNNLCIIRSEVSKMMFGVSEKDFFEVIENVVSYTDKIIY